MEPVIFPIPLWSHLSPSPLTPPQFLRPKLTEAFGSEYEGPHQALLKEMFVDPLSELHADFAKFQGMIEATVDLDEVDNHEFLIKASYSEELQTVCRDKGGGG